MTPDDERMLRECLAWAETHDGAERFNVAVFTDMLNRRRPLSDRQGKWVRGVYEKLFDVPQYENLVSSGKVLRGREVETPEVLRNLPKRPPQRRVSEEA